MWETYLKQEFRNTELPIDFNKANINSERKNIGRSLIFKATVKNFGHATMSAQQRYIHRDNKSGKTEFSNLTVIFIIVVLRPTIKLF